MGAGGVIKIKIAPPGKKPPQTETAAEQEQMEAIKKKKTPERRFGWEITEFSKILQEHERLVKNHVVQSVN